jgi:hypothetical protein
MELHICDVCRLVDGNTTLKECEYCEFCKAWICKADDLRVDRRMLAGMLRAVQEDEQP